MAQSGYTPILLYASGTATNVPLAANMTSSSSGAELALNYADGKLYYKDSGGTVQVLATKGGVGSSTTTQVLYNSSGLVVGSANMVFDGTTITSAFSGPHNGTVGATTASTGAFTTLSASSTVSGTGFSNYFAAPPTIGNTTPNAGTFTTLTGTSVTDSGLTSGRVTYAGTGGLLQDSANMTFDGTNLNSVNFIATGKFGISSNGSVPTSSALQIGSNGAGSRWLYNAPTGGEHDFTINGATIAYINATAFGTLGVDATINGLTVGKGGGAVSTNTALGYQALTANTSGDRSVAVGYQSAVANTTGINTSVGYQSLYTNTSGTENTAVGF